MRLPHKKVWCIILAYHWLKEDMTAGSGNESAWKVGETRSIEGKLTICQRGYHSSPSPQDALKYITGPILCLVEIGEPESNPEHTDKYVSRTRQLLKCVDMRIPLRLLMCDIADMENAKYTERTGKSVPVEAINSVLAGRKFAAGEITAEEMESANRALSSSYSSSSYYYSSYSSYSYYYSSYSSYSKLAARFNQLALEALENVKEPVL